MYEECESLRSQILRAQADHDKELMSMPTRRPKKVVPS